MSVTGIKKNIVAILRLPNLCDGQRNMLTKRTNEIMQAVSASAMNTLVLKPQSTAHLKGALLSAAKALEEEQHLSLQENFRQLLLMELLLARGELSHEQIGSRNNDDIYLQIDPKLTKQNPERRKLTNLHPSVIADIALMRQGRPCMKLIVAPAHASILKFWLSGAERCAATESRLVDMMEQLARIESNINSPKIEEVEERTKPADPEATAKKTADSLQSIQDAVIDISNNVADLRYPEQAALRQQKADEAKQQERKAEMEKQQAEKKNNLEMRKREEEKQQAEALAKDIKEYSFIVHPREDPLAVPLLKKWAENKKDLCLIEQPYTGKGVKPITYRISIKDAVDLKKAMEMFLTIKDLEVGPHEHCQTIMSSTDLAVDFLNNLQDLEASENQPSQLESVIASCELITNTAVESRTASGGPEALQKQKPTSSSSSSSSSALNPNHARPEAARTQEVKKETSTSRSQNQPQRPSKSSFQGANNVREHIAIMRKAIKTHWPGLNEGEDFYLPVVSKHLPPGKAPVLGVGGKLVLSVGGPLLELEYDQISASQWTKKD